MKFILLSLLINLVILFLPLLNLSSSEDEKESVKVVLNEIYTPIKALNLSQDVEILDLVEVIDETQEVEILQDFEKPKKEIVKKQKKEIVKKTAKGVKNQTAQISKTQNNSAQNGKKKSVDFCKENVGFKILNPKSSYEFPRKAKMLRLKGEYKVDVSFKISNKGIKIIKVKSDNEIFNEDAIKHTKNLKFEVLDENVRNCTITKPFIFVSR